MSTPDKRIKDITGRRYGKLVAVRRIGMNKKRYSTWECACDCGQTTTVPISSLNEGHTRSCGCLYRRAGGEASNGKRTPEHVAWASMKQRCLNRRSRHWPDYGGRGIAVCQAWQEDFKQFLADVGRRPSSKHSLDRYPDNDGNYEPGNVRWATAAEQQANRRKPQKRNWRNAAKRAYEIVGTFEDTLASYCGSKYAVAVESCSTALQLACMYMKVKAVEIPRFTYCSVPMSIIHAGGKVKFRDEGWLGMYQLKPYPIYDSARLLTSGMHIPGAMVCLSFHWSKHLPIGRGGAILCDDKKAVEWLKRARFDGRKEGVTPKHDKGLIIGIHAYMPPPVAAQGLMLMATIPEHNDPLPNSDYPDLSTMEIFK